MIHIEAANYLVDKLYSSAYNEPMKHTKDEITNFVKKYKRWPSSRVENGEWSMYNSMKKYMAVDDQFKEELMPFKQKAGAKKGQMSKAERKLYLFLMDSGGTGSF